MKSLKIERDKLDQIDGELVKLLQERFMISEDIANIKEVEKIPVLDQKREEEKINQVKSIAKSNYKESIANTFQCIMSESRKIQEETINTNRKKGNQI